jgi:DNA-directed RNA polymerase specialized sigma24 family protein
MIQPLEGQQIALDILNDQPGAWERFQEAYGQRLLARALRMLAACPPLRLRHQANDLVQDFLAVKVLRRSEVMFRPVADGQQPLWPRLCRSLVNHANTLLRPLNKGIHEVGIDQPSDLSEANRPPGVSDRRVIVQRLAVCLDALREALPVANGTAQVAYRLLLLLKVRMDLLPRLREAYQLEDGTLPEGASPVQMAEELVPWPASEAAQPLLPGNCLTLEDVWKQLAALAPVRGYEIGSLEAASILGIPSNTWNVYQMRGRKKIAAHHGHDIFDELFPALDSSRPCHQRAPQDVQ